MLEYRPEDVSLIFAGEIITGFAEDSFITAERDEDAYSYAANANGGGTRVKNSNRAGKVTVILNQSSPSNAVFAKALKDDQDSNTGVHPLLARDNSGASVIKAESAYVVKQPAAGFAKENSTRTYVLQCENLEMDIQGN